MFPPQRGEGDGQFVPPVLLVPLPWRRVAFSPRGDRPEQHEQVGEGSGKANEERSPGQAHGGRVFGG
eukprot:3310680-Lingulodinium_polyedra.AAC.1